MEKVAVLLSFGVLVDWDFEDTHEHLLPVEIVELPFVYSILHGHRHGKLEEGFVVYVT